MIGSQEDFVPGPRLFEAMAAHLAEGLMISELDGTVRYVNARTAEILGYEPEELVGRRGIELLAEEGDRARARDELEKRSEGRDSHYVTRIVRKDGTERWIEVHAAPLPDEGGEIVGSVATIEDVTRRREAERALRESERKLSRLFHTVPVAIAITRVSDGRLVEANQACLESFGVSREEALGRTTRELGMWADPEQREELARRIREEGSVEAMDARLRHSSGREWEALLFAHPLELDGEACMVSSALDITRRTRLEEELARLAAILEATPDFVGTCDPAGRTLWLNHAARAMLGIPREEELVGVHIRRYHPAETTRRIQTEGMPAAAKEGTWRGETELVTESGERIPVSQIILAHEDEEGRVDYFSTIIRDMRERRRRERAVEESQALLEQILETIVEGVVIFDPGGVLTYANHGASRILGRPVEEIVGRRFDDPRWGVRDPEEGTAEPRAFVFRRVLETESEVLGVEHLVAHPERGEVVVSVDGAPLRTPSGEIRGVVVSLRDVTDRRRVEAELERRALYDSLTGLPNRALFWDRLEHAIRRADREETILAVLFVDLDRFKSVNDSLGHTAGDRLLRKVADRLRRCFREEDTLARIGGDEFTVLVEDLGDPAEVRVPVRRLMSVLAEPFRLMDSTFRMTASIGVAVRAGEELGADALVRRADHAMFAVKGSGQTRYHVFDPEVDRAETSRLQRETELREAIERREFTLRYQPVVDLGSGRITGVETLARWERPGGDVVPPGRFVPLAEETGLIIPLGEQLIEEACRTVAAWRAEGLPPGGEGGAGERARAGEGVAPLRVYVNLSARQFDDPGLVDKIRAILARTEVPAGSLGVEVTERLVMQSVERVEELEELGVDVVIDDFGTGYSSLSYLRTLAVDGLKIDRSFVAGAVTDRRDEAIVRTIVTLGGTLGLEITAEGIETAAQLELLRELGCELGQGFHFARPMTADRFRELLREDPRW